jgi:hypothetical protein
VLRKQSTKHKPVKSMDAPSERPNSSMTPIAVNRKGGNILSNMINSNDKNKNVPKLKLNK